MLDNTDIWLYYRIMPERRKRQTSNLNKSNKMRSDTDKPSSKSELPNKSIIESLPIGIVAFDTDLRIIESNQQAKKLIKLGAYIDKSLAQGTDSPDRPGLDWTQQLKSAISSGKIFRFDGVHYTRNGKTKLLRIVCAPLKKGKARLGGTIIIEDVTGTVNIQRQLANAERLATVGKLASKVAHELNNPMDGILRYINLAMRIVEQEKLDKAKEYLMQCRQGLMRMVHIVSDLLEFARSTYKPLEYAKIEQIIEDAVKTMTKDAEALNIRILRDYASNRPRIRIGNLFQLFSNLTKNALEAMPNGGELTISTRLTPDNAIAVEFRDTGTGLPAEKSDVIFEPFFTTKDKGTGLGLAICKDIVETYNGRITAENAPAGGSIFTVYLSVTGNLQEDS